MMKDMIHGSRCMYSSDTDAIKRLDEKKKKLSVRDAALESTHGLISKAEILPSGLRLSI